MPTTPPPDDGRVERIAAEVIAEIPLWAELNRGLHEQIAASAEAVHLPAGELLFREGDPGDALYAVRRGRLEVVSASGTSIGVLGPGAAVGELALLTGQPRSATVGAVRDSELVKVGRDVFDRLMRDRAEFAAAFTTVLAQRLAGTVEPTPVTERRNVIAVVAMAASVPLDAFTRHLQETIGRWTRVTTLEAAAVDVTEAADLGRALDRCERDHDVVLLPAGADADPMWRAFCLRQADRILVIVDTRDLPSDPPPELVGQDGVDLAFFGSRPPAAVHSAPWLERVQPRGRHWIARGPAGFAHLERTARRMLGRSVGVVLSGGGARGLAHVGAVSALQEAGIIIDRYGGTSMGAFVAALFATGMPSEEIVAILRREVAERRPFADYTVPRRALIRSQRARRMFHRVFGEVHLEEFAHDCFGVTADLITAETLVHRRGEVRHIVGASMSLPGLAPPFPWGGRLLVDGGVVNNLPVDVMADTAEGPVVAVEVMRQWQDEWEARVAAARSGAAIERHARRRKGPVPTPSLVDTLACAIGLGSRPSLDAARDRAALTVTPDLLHVGLLDWGRMDVAIEDGRRAALAALVDQGDPTP